MFTDTTQPPHSITIANTPHQMNRGSRRVASRAGKVFLFSFFLNSLTIIYRQYTATHTPSPSPTPDEWGLETRREPVSFFFSFLISTIIYRQVYVHQVSSLSTPTNTSRQMPAPSYKNMQQSTGIYQPESTRLFSWPRRALSLG